MFSLIDLASKIGGLFAIVNTVGSIAVKIIFERIYLAETVRELYLEEDTELSKNIGDVGIRKPS